MSTTPAAELARVKLQHPVWLIRPDGDSRLIARRMLSNGHLQQVRASTLSALEHALWIREKFCGPCIDGQPPQDPRTSKRPAAPR
jgi:hypothetical protein